MRNKFNAGFWLLLPGLLLVPIMFWFVCTGTPKALAAPPRSVIDPYKYMRTTAVAWGHQHTAPTTIRPVLVHANGANTGITDLKLVEWGSSIRFSCQSATVFCFTMTTTIAATVNGLLTDANGPDGPGSCFRVEAGTFETKTVWPAIFATPNLAPGGRTGYCLGNATTILWPCRVDGDCSTSGVCHTTATANAESSTFDKIRGTFVVSIAASSADCFIDEGW